MNHGRTFLTAEWRWLAMLNWPVSEDLLAPHLPRGLELDLWQGRPYVSIVGFMFRETRLAGWSIPWHREFPEVNLRFYVRQGDDPQSRGVCFIREVVPLPAVTWVANSFYNENYITCRMKYKLNLTNGRLGPGSRVEYAWRRKRWHRVAATAYGKACLPVEETTEHYFTENYWGYTALRDGGTAQYRVEHPPWHIWPATDVTWDCDVAAMYGPEWCETLSQPPESAFVIEGAPVQVYTGRRLETATPAQSCATKRYADHV